MFLDFAGPPAPSLSLSRPDKSGKNDTISGYHILCTMALAAVAKTYRYAYALAAFFLLLSLSMDAMDVVAMEVLSVA